MIRKCGTVLAAGALLVSSSVMALAGTDAQQTDTLQKVQPQQGALMPGGPAGVQKAQWIFVNGHWIWLVGGAFVVAGAALGASGGHASTSTSTTGTGL